MCLILGHLLSKQNKANRSTVLVLTYTVIDLLSSKLYLYACLYNFGHSLKLYIMSLQQILRIEPLYFLCSSLKYQKVDKGTLCGRVSESKEDEIDNCVLNA